jgi:hypothetical protein
MLVADPTLAALTKIGEHRSHGASCAAIPTVTWARMPRFHTSGERVLLPWQVVKVIGQSMTPTLLPGDLVLVRHGVSVPPGAIVVARFRSCPDQLVIKRAVGKRDGGWILASDNARAGSDSRHHGLAEVEARVVLMWRSPNAGLFGVDPRRWHVPRRPKVHPPCDF